MNISLVSALAEVIGDLAEEEDVRIAAAAALGQLGEEASFAIPALKRAVDLARGEGEYEVETALKEALRKMRKRPKDG